MNPSTPPVGVSAEQWLLAGGGAIASNDGNLGVFACESDAAKCITAHNHTYGLGINPESVPMMREALEDFSWVSIHSRIPTEEDGRDDMVLFRIIGINYEVGRFDDVSLLGCCTHWMRIPPIGCAALAKAKEVRS